MLRTSPKQIKKQSGGPRSIIINTRRGKLVTPLFMPVGTKGVIKGLTPEQVKTAGAEIVLANTYHLHLAPGEGTVKKLGGVHGFGKWQGPILTDSGGFQVFSLAHSRKITEKGVHFKDPKTGDKAFISPEISMQIQLDLGADIIMTFDDVTGLDEHSRARTEEAVERTHHWLVRCIKEYKKLTKNMDKPPLLFGIVQGGLDKTLRAKSLKFVQSQEVAGVAIGGLSVGESRAEMHAMLKFLAPLYDERPRYLMGVGDPIDFRFAIEHGIDMMDCVMPTRNARHATAWVTGDNKIHLTNERYKNDTSPLDKKCDCYTCKSGYSKGFLRHQFKMGESLAGSLVSIHNIRYLTRITEVYKK